MSELERLHVFVEDAEGGELVSIETASLVKLLAVVEAYDAAGNVSARDAITATRTWKAT